MIRFSHLLSVILLSVIVLPVEAQWITTGSNIYYNSGKVSIGTNSAYYHSALHVKASTVSGWAILSEALSNQRIIGLGHNGDGGYIAVSYLDASGYSPLNFMTSNITRMTIKTDGKVGIGTVNPAHTLDVNGTINATSILVNGAPLSGGGGSQWTTAGSNIHFNSGNVGVGTTNPDQKLTVKGNVHAEEVLIDLQVPGPDYVFEEDYDLPTLTEVESYIKQNKHLPEIPSAKEMEAEGIRSGEMHMLLLKKVEELTLYVIEQNKKMLEQQEIIAEQNNRIAELEGRLK